MNVKRWLAAAGVASAVVGGGLVASESSVDAYLGQCKSATEQGVTISGCLDYWGSGIPRNVGGTVDVVHRGQSGCYWIDYKLTRSGGIDWTNWNRVGRFCSGTPLYNWNDRLWTTTPNGVKFRICKERVVDTCTSTGIISR
jgi:hypothetical protein